MTTFLQLNDLNAYKISFHLANEVWDIAIHWERTPRYTIGEQFIRSTDSISANIAEGFGRHTKKDKIRHYRIGMGSIYESMDWAEKSWRRKLLTKEQYNSILTTLKSLPKEMNHLIRFTNEKLAI